MQEPQGVSYSKISTYLDCPELYRQRYVLKNRGVYQPLQEALIKGTLAHAMVELLLNKEPIEVAIKQALYIWATDTCCLKLSEDNPELEEGTVDFEYLETYAKLCGKLLARCSESYIKEDKIRNKDGTPPRSPLDYPPGAFKEVYISEGLDKLKFWIDNDAVRANPSFTRFSLANTVAIATSYAYLFQLPSYVSEVEEIEYNLSQEEVPFAEGRYYWNGIIDSIYKTEEGATIINDHKTEKNKRRPEDVAFDLQLNSYAGVRYQQTQHLPDYISITHLATNTLSAAHTSSKIVNLSMDYLEKVQKEIDWLIDNKDPRQEWIKKWPSKYGSPCVRRHWKTDKIEQACPYIRQCWPEYATCIEQELKEYFNE